MKFLGKIFSAKTFVGIILAGLAIPLILRLIDPLWNKKKKTIKIYGSVLEKKEELKPVNNASVNFLNIREERTDSNGRFSTELQGRGVDSITIEVSIPDGQAISKKIQVDYHKKELFLSPLIFPVTESVKIKEISKDEFKKTQKTIPQSIGIAQNSNTPDSLSATKGKSEYREASINTDIADYAVVGFTNGKRDISLINITIDWIKKSSGNSPSISQSMFIEKPSFDQVFEGSPKVIVKANAGNKAKYACLIRSTISYSTSRIDESLIIANRSYEVMILDAATGKVIDSFEYTEKSSGVSEEMAKKRVTDSFINYLNTRKLTI